MPCEWLGVFKAPKRSSKQRDLFYFQCYRSVAGCFACWSRLHPADAGAPAATLPRLPPAAKSARISIHARSVYLLYALYCVRLHCVSVDGPSGSKHLTASERQVIKDREPRIPGSQTNRSKQGLGPCCFWKSQKHSSGLRATEQSFWCTEVSAPVRSTCPNQGGIHAGGSERSCCPVAACNPSNTLHCID